MREKAEFPGETGSDGSFQRQESRFRNRVTASGLSGYRAEAGRYHLYVALACPWAHRTIIFRLLKKLENVISMTVLDPIRDERGWAVSAPSGCGPDPINGFKFLREAYIATDPDFEGRVTVPVLWDKKEGIIVSNESSEIIRMLNSEFDEWGDSDLDFYPELLREEIDAVNEIVYNNVNNGVYRAGFATTQKAYEEAFDALFHTLDDLEDRLFRQRYLVGDRLTEADWRLFTTLVRFDPVYVGHFKCNRRRLVDYPNLWGYLRELYQIPGVSGTVDMDHIKQHYYVTHRSINPTGIVPKGPEIDFMEPHGRD
jgi:putative glutathione S-transferase